MNTSLYDPSFEHDSCGFGLLARIDGQVGSKLVDQAFVALARLSHRGAVNADGVSGDGCGVLLRGAQRWLRELANAADIVPGARFAAGLVFCDPHAPDVAREALARCLADERLTVAGWRVVPLNLDACGSLAAATRPDVCQVFVDAAPGMDGERFERALFRARRRAELAMAGDAAFHVASLSAASIVYKAMAAPGRLREVFPDLAMPSLAANAMVFHQRFSTNTAPSWALAQPFRVLAHNGEINTIAGNRRWMQARAPQLQSDRLRLDDLGPPVGMHGSDSQSLDNALELLLAGGMDMLQAMRVLVPPAWQAREDIDPDLAAFYEYFACSSEPWDGPAGLVACDERHAVCALDRNGLRPARWALSDEHCLLVASEAGLWDVPASHIVAKGQLGPGEMLAVDFHQRRLLRDADVDAVNRARAPFRRWLAAGTTYLESDLVDPALAAEPMPPDTLRRMQKLYGLTREERETVLKVLAETESEGIGAMGDDTPLAPLSRQVRPLYDCFRQAFAQVTNPPIDPLRERMAMSLTTRIGSGANLFELDARHACQVVLNSPVLSQRKLRQLLALPRFADRVLTLDLCAQGDGDWDAVLQRLADSAAEAVRKGARIVFLTDRYPQPDSVPIHALLATGAVHARLVREGLRCCCNLVVETGTARDAHQIACLLGFGATAVYPWLAYQSLLDLARSGHLTCGDGEPIQIGRSYRRGIRKGLLKILSRMGIATVDGYRGAQLFEIIGLDSAVVERCFPGTPSRLGGAGFDDLVADQRQLAAEAWSDATALRAGGKHKFVHGGEYHMYNPEVVDSLQLAVRSGDMEDYRRYAHHVNARPPSTLRDLLHLREADTALPLGEMEPATSILKRFDSAGMSLGALSPEAHEALAIAMNRLGGRSNSGEGGEDPARYGTERTAKIKQVASGRFGVTPAYLVNAEVLQIKIAQGAKPGEGGQLPGHKVNETIARLRHARPGIGLISPPPHHDVYSIEDLAQLIYDLKQVNPAALVSVKLVSHAGVGTVAAGVVKAGADLITVSGYDGGTGASPLTSIHHAGTPWEMGLAETRQTLRLNGLRERVRLQIDGGLKTGLDVIKAAILGADSFGFGTAPMVALGCRYLRLCHLNNCATGVATQNEILRREHFVGLPEMVMNFFRFVAEDVRHWLARLGERRLEDVIGRTDLLDIVEGVTLVQRRLQLHPLLATDVPSGVANAVRHPTRIENDLAARIAADTATAVATCAGGAFAYAVANTDRSIGACLSGDVARRWGDAGMTGSPIALHLTGSAGQSLGAWNAGGVHIHVEGEANDYVGKGMAGGRIVLHPPRDAGFVGQDAAIIGNTCLYGATGGELFAAGRAGQRFAVRNSGAVAVVEGIGEHGCEYMTGGVVVVLGRAGLNFGAGMTGGFAYVLDRERDFVDRYNHELVDILRITPESMEHHMQHLRGLVARHVELTGSRWGRHVLGEFSALLNRFWLVKPRAASLATLADALRRAA